MAAGSRNRARRWPAGSPPPANAPARAAAGLVAQSSRDRALRARRQRGKAFAQARRCAVADARRAAPHRHGARARVRARAVVAMLQPGGAALRPGAGTAASRRARGRSAFRRSAARSARCMAARKPLQLQVAQPRVERAQATGEVIATGHQQFGRDRRRRRAQVGGEVGQAEVGFVADRRNHRHRRCGDRARQTLVVERPQVLERTAAAGQQQHVVAAGGAPRAAASPRSAPPRPRPGPAPAARRPRPAESAAPARSARRARPRRWAR